MGGGEGERGMKVKGELCHFMTEYKKHCNGYRYDNYKSFHTLTDCFQYIDTYY